MPKLFPTVPTKRLVDTILPHADVADIRNPVLRRLAQIPEFGNGTCTPQMAGVKLRESFASVPAPHLVEQIAHAKRWIREKITGYVDGELIVYLRKPKYIMDVIKVIQYAQRTVATLRFLESLLQQEVAMANAWAREANHLVNFTRENLPAEGLRTAAEKELLDTLDVAAGAIEQQIAENGQALTCLI